MVEPMLKAARYILDFTYVFLHLNVLFIIVGDGSFFSFEFEKMLLELFTLTVKVTCELVCII